MNAEPNAALQALMPVELTAKTTVSGRIYYAWEQRERNYSTSAFQAPASPLRGTTTVNPAREVNNHDVATGTIVFVRQAGSVDGQVLYEFQYEPSGGGTGDVVGPSSATDTAVALYNGTTGKLIKNSPLTVNVLGTAAGNAGASGSYGYGYFGYYATDTTGSTKQVILQTSITPYSVPGLSVNNGGAISYLLNVGGSWQAVVQPSGTFLLSGNGGGTNNCAYAVTRGSAFSPTNYTGIDATCTVKVGGVDKTMTIYGGIVVSIA